MNVSLPEDLENYVNHLVASGQYPSAGEVMRDALQLLKEREAIRKMRAEELRAEIMLGVEDLRAGRSQSFNSGEEVFEEIEKRARKRKNNRRNGE